MKKSEIENWIEKKLVVAKNKLNDKYAQGTSHIYWQGVRDALLELDYKIKSK